MWLHLKIITTKTYKKQNTINNNIIISIIIIVVVTVVVVKVYVRDIIFNNIINAIYIIQMQ